MRLRGKMLYSSTGHRYYNMAHAHCMLDNLGYKHTLILCNTYCFFHCNNCCKNAPHGYVVRTLPVLFILQQAIHRV